MIVSKQQPAARHQAMCNVLGSQEEQNIFTEAMTTLGPCYLTPCTSHHRVPPKTLTLPATLNCCLHCLPAWRAPCTVYCSNCSKYSTVPCRHYPLPLSITACDMTHTLTRKTFLNCRLLNCCSFVIKIHSTLHSNWVTRVMHQVSHKIQN